MSLPGFRHHVVPEEVAGGIHTFPGIPCPTVRVGVRNRVTVPVGYDTIPLPVYVLGTVVVVFGCLPAIPFAALDGLLDIGSRVGFGVVSGGTLPSEHLHERHSGNDDYHDRGHEERDDYGDPSQVHSASSSGCKCGDRVSARPAQNSIQTPAPMSKWVRGKTGTPTRHLEGAQVPPSRGRSALLKRSCTLGVVMAKVTRPLDMSHLNSEGSNRMSAATDYAARHDAVAAQQSRIFGPEPPGDPWGAEAEFFRMDPNRDPEPNLRIISSYLRPGDVLVDVGGGAGRVCLPMARHCREVVMVEPSAGMGAEFDASRREAGIDNARRVQADWMDVQELKGDVVFSGCVTYFVRDIVPFVEKLAAAARRRVMITLWSEPPPCRGAPLFKLAHGEKQVLLPGFRHLLPVLWEMDILPDVLVLPDSPWWENRAYSSREDALKWAVEGPWLRAEDRKRAAGIFRDNFDDLFIPGAEGLRPRWQRPMRELLITWETA